MQVFNAVPFAGFLFILISLAGRIRLLNIKGVIVSSRPEKMKKSALLLFAIFGFIFLVWLFEIVKPVFQLTFFILPEILTSRIFESIFLNVSGAILILISMILWIITLVHFKTSLRFGLNKINTGKLITSGIFSLSRNPFFVSLDLYFIGTALIFLSLFFIGFTILAGISIHFFILKEEKYMRNIYGQGYKDYSKKVRRYF